MIQVGVIGCGTPGRERIRAFQENGGSNVTAICDVAAHRLYELRDRFPQLELCMDWRGLIRREDVQLVVIASPVATHFEMAWQAIQAGKHVLIEPPFTETTEQAEELVELASHKGVRLAVAFSDLFSPEIGAIQDLLDRGEFGDLTFIDAFRSSAGSVATGATVIRDLAAHDVAIIEYLTGKTPSGVLATGSCHTQDGQVDVAYINLDYGDGLMANLHANRLTPIHSRRFMIGGTLQCAILDASSSNQVLYLYDGAAPGNQVSSGGRGEIRIPALAPIDSQNAMAQHLVEAIDDGGDLRIDARLALRVSQVLDSCERSLYEDAGQVLKSRSTPAAAVLTTGQRDAFDMMPSAPITAGTGAIGAPVDAMALGG